MAHNCKKCGICCRVPTNYKFINVILTEDDILNISDRLKLPLNIFLKKYCILKELEIDKTYFKFFIKAVNGSCVFLKDNLCVIHDYKPTQCKLAPNLLFKNTSLWSHLDCMTTQKSTVVNSDIDNMFITEIMKNYSFGIESI